MTRTLAALLASLIVALSAPTAELKFDDLKRQFDYDAEKPLEHDFAFFSGNILHGAQYAEPAKRDLPLTYYTAPTAIAREMLPERERRSGQLVWSGGSGWVWLRGDRQPPERLGELELA